jgi:hypothetical protein
MLGSRFADENYIRYFWALTAFVMVLRHFPDHDPSQGPPREEAGA